MNIKEVGDFIWGVIVIFSPGIYLYIFQKYIDNKFDKKIETYKNELEKSNIRYTKLHEDRAEVIKKLYVYIVEIEGELDQYGVYLYERESYINLNESLETSKLDDLPISYKSCGNEEKDKKAVKEEIEKKLKENEQELNKIQDKLDDELHYNFHRFMHQNKIFFSKELWSDLEIIESKFKKLKNTNDNMYGLIKFNKEILNDYKKSSEKVLKCTKLKLENQFKHLLGVESIIK